MKIRNKSALIILRLFGLKFNFWSQPWNSWVLQIQSLMLERYYKHREQAAKKTANLLKLESKLNCSLAIIDHRDLTNPATYGQAFIALWALWP